MYPSEMFEKVCNIIKRGFIGISIVSNLANIQEGHCVLKWGFTWTFPGNQDARFKKISELTFIRFC